MYDITSDWNTLVRQATITADTYMASAVHRIDAIFGKGYAAKHPELVIAYMDICERDFANASKTVREKAKLEMRELEMEE